MRAVASGWQMAKGASVRFRVLGPVELTGPAGPIAIGSVRQRSLLALLLARANRVVPLESLVEDLWNGRPPATARKALHVHLSGLRRALAAAGAAPLRTEAYGYQLPVGEDDLDLLRFERLAAEGRAAGQPEEAARLLREALELWRGLPFADAPLDVLQREVAPALESAHQAALEDRIDADLRRGRHHELVGELGTLVASHPVRERVRGQLMVALYRCGRQTEALDVYREGRKLLVDELGLEPGPELRRLEHAILTADPALDPPFAGSRSSGGSGPPTPRPIPAQLPPRVADFIGREGELERLTAALRESPVVAICGKAGVGKTTLALEIAHRIRGEFADGQLYADLRGPTGEARDAGEVTGMFLRGLGIEPAAVPASMDERTALYRSLLAGKQTLVVLDNAGDTAHIRTLLPGEPRCAVLLTSRARPTGLPGATIEDIDVFTADTALALLGRIVPDRRIAEAPDEAARVARYCGYLPLAVRIAGARLAARSHWPVRRLADLLSDERRRLDTLATDDLDVRSSLTLSENALRPGDRRALRLLSTPDVPDLAEWLVAAVLDQEPTEALEVAERLVEARLLDVSERRYRFHDLIRLHARQSAESPDRYSAIARAAGAVLGIADVVVRPYQEVGFAVDPDAALRHPTTKPSKTVQWWDEEWQTAVGLVRQSAAAGMLDLAAEMLERVAPYASAHGYHAESRQLAEVVLAEAMRQGDCRIETIARCVLAVARYEADDIDSGRRIAEEALNAARSADLPGVEARLLQVVADSMTQHGETPSALVPYRRALALHRRRGDPLGEAQALSQLGWAHRVLGNPVHALTDLKQAVTILRRLDRPRHLCRALIRIGATETLLRRPDQSRAALTEALELCAEHGYGRSESVAHFRLGNLARETGDFTAARAHLEAALALGNRYGERLGLGWVVLALGKTHTAAGEPERALAVYDEALTIFRGFDARSGEAFTFQHIGLAQRALGRTAEAHRHLTTAIRMLDDLDDTQHAAAARTLLDEP